MGTPDETLDYLQSLPYEEYLQSKHWREVVRPAALKRAMYRCQLCGENPGSLPLEVHHNNYEWLGRELPSDVIVLCGECHGHYHAPRYHTSHTGIVCPSCGTEFVIELSIVHNITE